MHHDVRAMAFKKTSGALRQPGPGTQIVDHEHGRASEFQDEVLREPFEKWVPVVVATDGSNGGELFERCENLGLHDVPGVENE